MVAEARRLADLWISTEMERLRSGGPEERAQELADLQAGIERQLLELPPEETGDPLPPMIPAAFKAHDPRRKQPAIVIVGAGVGGICMAVRLRQAGFTDITILEKAGEPGGTWHHNRYPGVACDVSSYYYCFSFHLNPGWSQMFAPGDEIRAYLQGVADTYGITPLIRFDSEVTSCTYEQDHWHIRLTGGRALDADILISAVGFLHVPHRPDIPGLDTFRGQAVHSTQWDPGLDPKGLKIGVVGTGSSAVQIVSALAGKAESVSVFQRTPQWVFPYPNEHYSERRKQVLSRYPELMGRLFEFFAAWYNGEFGTAVVGNQDAQEVFRSACVANLETIRDEELRRKLTPDYPIMCKRLVFSSTYYRDLQDPSVHLVTEPVGKVVPEGIVTADGALHELDVLVLATGFKTHAFCRPLNISVAGGPSLEESWKDGAASFESVAVSGFPNLFVLGGPYSTVGNLSTMSCTELQTAYIMRLINALEDSGADAVVPRAEAQQRFVAEMQSHARDTIWLSGCKSWYLDANGTVTIWTRTPQEFRERMLRGPDLADFAFLPSCA